MTNVIPIYSEGDRIGGLILETDGKTSGAVLNEVGSQQMLSILRNNRDFVLNLTNGTVAKFGIPQPSVKTLVTYDQITREKAVELATKVYAKSGLELDGERFEKLAKSIEKFLRGE